MEESRRVVITFRHTANLWKGRSEEWKSEGLAAGKAAYASTQFLVYNRLASDAEYTHRKIRNNRPAGTDGLIPVPTLDTPAGGVVTETQAIADADVLPRRYND